MWDIGSESLVSRPYRCIKDDKVTVNVTPKPIAECNEMCLLLHYIRYSGTKVLQVFSF